MSQLRQPQIGEWKNGVGGAPAPLPAAQDHPAVPGKASTESSEEILSLLRKILTNQKADIARRRRGMKTSLTFDFIALLAFVVFVVLLLRH